ncbi:MAG TPA: TIGR00730 family Rossman fold protein [Holophagaceae bacterium]|nr:TIGR00730 family Rossman fold protein [Holophagaceae bacterium]
MSRTFAVFTGSASGADPRFREAATDLGRTLARRGHGLVYGGAQVGLMGAVADAALAEGGRVTGVLPDFMVAKEIAHPGLSRLHIVQSMHDRKALMADLCDGFIMLPGGFGTLDETFEALTWAQLGLHAKPVVLLNVAGYYDALLAFVARAEAEGFVRPRHQGMLRAHREVEALVNDLETWRPAAAASKWD